MDRNRLEKAVNQLKEQGISVDTSKYIYGGINNHILKAKGKDDKEYALKIYKNKNIGDCWDRYQYEKVFLSYLKEIKVKNSPEIVVNNDRERWSLMTWINGRRIMKIRREDIREISDFIKKTNLGKDQKKTLKLKKAAEACTSITELINVLYEKDYIIRNIRPTSELSADAKNWYQKNVGEKMRKICSKIMNEDNPNKEWENVKKEMVASQSDVGIHNMKRTKNGIFFYDFEYAGRDDLSKLICDWTTQPNYRFNKEEENQLTQEVKETRKRNEQWIERYHKMKPLISIKWCQIMLNKIKVGLLNEDQYLKTKEYYNNFTLELTSNLNL